MPFLIDDSGIDRVDTVSSLLDNLQYGIKLFEIEIVIAVKESDIVSSSYINAR